MNDRIQGGDAYENAILRPERNVAPRVQVGWAAIKALLSDGAWHDRDECIDIAVATGLAERTALNILENAIRYEQVEPRRGREQRGGFSGIPVRNVSLYVAYRLVDQTSAEIQNRKLESHGK